MKKYEIMSDEQLICDFRKGESEIVDYIMEKYKHLVRQKAKAMYLLGGENDDLIQEGMIGLFKAVNDFNAEQGSSFHSFAELCISRQMYTAIEASKRKKHIPLNSYVSIYDDNGEDEAKKPPLVETIQTTANSNPEDLFIGKEYVGRLEAELDHQLSSLEKKVLYLHLRGSDYKTIAKLLGKTNKTIDNALQRIKLKAKKLI